MIAATIRRVPTPFIPGNIGRYHAVDVIVFYVAWFFGGHGSALVIDPANALYAPFEMVGGARLFGVVMLVSGAALGLAYIRQREKGTRSPLMFLTAWCVAVLCIIIPLLYYAEFGALTTLASWLPRAALVFWLAAEGRPPWTQPASPPTGPATDA